MSNVEEVKSGKAKRREKKLKNEPQSVTADEVPESLQLLDFCEARAKELSGMMTALQRKGGSKRTFQKLPRHMRRRATSHNIKRLPWRLRDQAITEMDVKTGNEKRLSRRKRRRPNNLKMEYHRRQKDKKWLETHLWHAKRMKMVTKWGYRLALCCNDKGVRANYRFMRNGAILSDISYFSCIELQGAEADLIQLMKPMFVEATGPTPLSCLYLDGTKEGVAFMYKPRLYPYHCLGPVHFLWQYRKINEAQKERRVWLWIHPSMYESVIEVLQLELKFINSQAEIHPESSPSSKPHPLVTISSLKDKLVRFRLVGPKAISILLSVLHLADEVTQSSSNIIEKSFPQEAEGEMEISDLSYDPTKGCEVVQGEQYLRACQKWEEIANASFQRKWWQREEVFLSNSQLLKNQFQTLGSGKESISNGYVLGLAVKDPRLYTPNKRSDVGCASPLRKKTSKESMLLEMANLLVEEDHETGTEEDKVTVQEVTGVTGDGSESDNFPSLPLHPFSPIWNHSIRNDVSTSKIPDHIINNVRSKFFLKPAQLDLGSETSVIPLLLIHKKYSSLNKGRPLHSDTTGWDIIIPCEWGMAFWIPIIYHGGRACGLKELSVCTSLECLVPLFPEDYPDTVAGQLAEKEECLLMEEKYSRYPPDKRPNFGKLRVQFPFQSQWNDLLSKTDLGRKRQVEDSAPYIEKKSKLSEEGEAHESIDCSCSVGVYYVVRCSEDLAMLCNFVDTLFSKCWRKRASRTLEKYNQIYQRHNMEGLVRRHNRGIVAVRLEVWSHGTLSAHSTISLPAHTDLSNIKEEVKSFIGPVETKCPRGMTVVEKGCLFIGEYQLPTKDIKGVKQRRKDHNKEVNAEYLSPTQAFSMKPVYSGRTIIGRVQTTVGYRHTSSKSSAIGHCTLGGIIELCKTCFVANSNSLVVLTRGHTLQYGVNLLRVIKQS